MKQQCSLVVMVTILCAEVHTQAGAQTFSCDASLSTPLCPGTVASCTCNATGTFAQTRWVFTTLNLQCPGGVNYIPLAQCAPAASGTCGPYLSAANNIGSSCPTSLSTFNITANPSLNGLVIECRDLSTGSPGTLVGTKNISVLASPGPVGNIALNSPSVDQLTVAWAPPTTGGVPTSYNVSINDSSNTLVPIPANGPLQNTFTGLISDTLYTVSVVAINCAGTSNVTSANRTMAAPPMGIQMVSVFNPNNTLRQLEVSWIPVGGSVTMYTVRVVGNGASVGPTTTTCTTSPCLYVQQVYVPATSYTIFVASINDRAVGPENSTTIYGTTASNIVINSTDNIYASNATIGCSFLNNQSFYCVVCCSTDPSVPPDSSVYNISTSRGTEVTVDLDGLTSGQMYYCKAAATNTNSASCGGPVVGGVKVFFSFTLAGPSHIPTPSPGAMSGPSAAIIGGVIGGCAGVLVVVVVVFIIITFVYKSRRRRKASLSGIKNMCIPHAMSPSHEEGHSSKTRNEKNAMPSAMPSLVLM